MKLLQWCLLCTTVLSTCYGLANRHVSHKVSKFGRRFQRMPRLEVKRNPPLQKTGLKKLGSSRIRPISIVVPSSEGSAWKPASATTEKLCYNPDVGSLTDRNDFSSGDYIYGRGFHQRRIAGGRKADHNRWPFFVSIMEHTKKDPSDTCFNGTVPCKKICGGSIVGNQYVITAAHCFPKVTSKFLKKLLNQTSSSKNLFKVKFTFSVRILAKTGFNEDVHVSSIAVHSGWFKTEKTRVLNGDELGSTFCNTYGDDIAILKLASPLTNFNPSLQQVCLPSESDDSGFSKCETAGYGSTSGDGKVSDVFKSVPLNIEPFEKCLSKLSIVRTDASKSLVCVKSPSENSGPCPGDSGGPLFCHSPKSNRWFLVGLISFSQQSNLCGINKVPDVLTAVLHHRQWIDKTLGYYLQNKDPEQLVIYPSRIDEIWTDVKVIPDCDPNNT